MSDLYCKRTYCSEPPCHYLCIGCLLSLCHSRSLEERVVVGHSVSFIIEEQQVGTEERLPHIGYIQLQSSCFVIG